MIFRDILLRLLILGLGLTAAAQATDVGGYIPGTTGLKGGTQPGPGVYPISFEFAYHSTDFRDQNGDRVREVGGRKFSGRAEAFVSIIGITYVTDLKFLGANYSVRVADISAEADLDRRIDSVRLRQKQSGNVNLYIEPVNLSWHLPRFDLFTSYGAYAPVGAFRSIADDPSTASDRWTHLLSAGMTAFLDERKKWAIAIVPRYEINQHNMHEDFKAGQETIVEWGISRTFRIPGCDPKEPRFTIDVGPIGYTEHKITSDQGLGVTRATERAHGNGAGVELGVGVPKLQGLRCVLRFEQEFQVQSRTQGQLGVLRLSVKF